MALQVIQQTDTWVHIEIDASDIESRGCFGEGIATIDIKHENGLTTRYFIRLHQNERTNNFFAELTALHKNKQPSRRLVGRKLDLEERRESRIG